MRGSLKSEGEILPATYVNSQSSEEEVKHVWDKKSGGFGFSRGSSPSPRHEPSPEIDEDSDPEQDPDVLRASQFLSKVVKRVEKKEGKRAREPKIDIDLVDDAYMVPDLHEYFNQFNTDAKRRIAMCRTYANYLAQREIASKEKDF